MHFFQSNPNYADQPVEVQVFSRSRMGGRKAPQGLVSLHYNYNMLFSLYKDIIIKPFSYIFICLPILLYYLYLKGILDLEHFNQIDVLWPTPHSWVPVSDALWWTVGPTTKSMSLTLLEVRVV